MGLDREYSQLNSLYSMMFLTILQTNKKVIIIIKNNKVFSLILFYKATTTDSYKSRIDNLVIKFRYKCTIFPALS